MLMVDKWKKLVMIAQDERPKEMVTFQLEHTYNLALRRLLERYPLMCKNDWLRDAVREKLERDLKRERHRD
jgi:hypothetical protein